jgi:3-phenylpropionate/trans-cinnamate dioxygenase ferredoxin reductase subunit
VLRGADHALALQRALAAGRNLVVVGGGFVGLEVAATVRQAGMNVTVLEQAPRILQRVAGAEVSQRLRALHQAHGVRILEQHQLASLRGQEIRARRCSPQHWLQIRPVRAGQERFPLRCVQ